MKIFANHKAEKAFTDAYNRMDPVTRLNFGERCRELAAKKIGCEPGEYDEFYLTVKDIKELIRTNRPFPL